MTTRDIIIEQIAQESGRVPDMTDSVSDHFDSLALVDFALILSDKLGKPELFESHAFFSAKTIGEMVAAAEAAAV